MQINRASKVVQYQSILFGIDSIVSTFFFVSFFCIAWLLLAPQLVAAAELSLSPSAGSFVAGKEFTVKITVVPDSGESVNAADGKVSFDTEMLSVSSFSKDGSTFSLWTSEPSFSNTAGTINFSGGTPTAFSTQGTVITVKFKAKKAGKAKVSFASGSILAADGKGTDVYKKGNDANFTIIEEAIAPPPPDPEPDAGGDAGDASATDTGLTPPAPAITSTTHAKPENWYATSTGQFAWTVPSDVIAIRTLLSDKDDAKLTSGPKSVTASTTLTKLKDGISYFYVQFKNESGWGEVAKRAVRVDTVPPKEFDVALLEGTPAKLSFKTEDELSGLDRYEIVIGGKTLATVKAKDIGDGSTPLPPQDGGDQEVNIKAYDLAGNVREAKRHLTLPRVEKLSAKGAADEAAANAQQNSGWTLERILTIFFALIIGALGAWIYYSRKAMQQQQSHLLGMVLEMRDKNDRVFSAMREEFEQMIGALDNKPQLTPAERDFLEKTKEVLDISEELVDSSIEELKKTLRNQ